MITGPVVMSRVAEEYQRDIAGSIASDRLAAKAGRPQQDQSKARPSEGKLLRMLWQGLSRPRSSPIPVG